MSDLHKLPLYWRDTLAGHLPMMQHFRPPMSEAELAEFSQMLPLVIRSTSFLLDVRSGDFRLAIVGDEMRIIARDRLCPGDISCIESLIPADPIFERDEEERALEQSILAEHGMKSRGGPA